MASVKVYAASPPTGSLCHRRNEILFHTAHAQMNTRGPTSCNCVYVCVLGCCTSACTHLLHECFGCSHHHIGALAVPQLPCKICMSSLPHRMLRAAAVPPMGPFIPPLMNLGVVLEIMNFTQMIQITLTKSSRGTSAELKAEASS